MVGSATERNGERGSTTRLHKNIRLPVAAYYLALDAKGNLVETVGKGFDPAAYSRMKYGVRTDLQYFAGTLAEAMRTDAPELFHNPRPPAFLTMYKAVAPPSTELARLSLNIVNESRLAAGLKAGEMVKVFRAKDSFREYGALPSKDRREALEKEGQGDLMGRRLDGYQVTIIDDIRVTGTYERMMRKILGDYKDIHAVFLAACDESVMDMAHVEGLLNGTEISKLEDLLPFIQSDNFVFTRRFLKMLLRAPAKELESFMVKMPSQLLELSRHGIKETGQEVFDAFPAQCGIIFGHKGSI